MMKPAGGGLLPILIPALLWMPLLSATHSAGPFGSKPDRSRQWFYKNLVARYEKDLPMFNEEVFPQQKMVQEKKSSLPDGGRQLYELENVLKKRDFGGMSMSITHNLDILRRGLLRELSLRQREQDRRNIMQSNQKFLSGIGKKRRR